MAYFGIPSWLEKVTAEIIKLGPLPRHVGILMDGNRRYAKKNNMTLGDAFTQTVLNMERTLNWGFKLGIQEMTVYAVSIENFKRSEAEVNTFMKVAKMIFKKMLDKVDTYNKLGICVRVIGNWKYIDVEIANLMARIMLATKKNDKFTFNIAFAYTSRDDITHSIQCIMEGVENGLLNINDINEELISNCLYSNKSNPLDLVIRTSGVTRLSSFMLWNVGTAIIYNFSIFWPEFTFWSLSKAILYYQYHYSYWNNIQKQIKHLRGNISKRGYTFLAYTNERYWQQIEARAQN